MYTHTLYNSLYCATIFQLFCFLFWKIFQHPGWNCMAKGLAINHRDFNAWDVDCRVLVTFDFVLSSATTMNYLQRLFSVNKHSKSMLVIFNALQYQPNLVTSISFHTGLFYSHTQINSHIAKYQYLHKIKNNEKSTWSKT